MHTRGFFIRRVLALAFALGAALPASALTLDEARQYLLELRGRLQAVVLDPRLLIQQVYCSDLRLANGERLRPSRDSGGCWYRLPLGDGVVEFEYAIAARRPSSSTIALIVEQAQRADSMVINGRRVPFDPEGVLVIENDEFGRMAWLEHAKQLIFIKDGVLYNVHLRGSDASGAYAARVAAAISHGRR